MKCTLSAVFYFTYLLVMHSAATNNFSNQTNVKGGIVHNPDGFLQFQLNEIQLFGEGPQELCKLEEIHPGSIKAKGRPCARGLLSNVLQIHAVSVGLREGK